MKSMQPRAAHGQPCCRSAAAARAPGCTFRPHAHTRLSPRSGIAVQPAASSSTPASQESPSSNHPPQTTALRVRLARSDEDFDAVARVWAEALLLPGLTEFNPPDGPEEVAARVEQVAARLRQSHERKLRAAVETRELRARGQALVASLRRGGMGGLEFQSTRRQLEAVRSQLRRARRRRMWACLVAYYCHTQPQSQPASQPPPQPSPQPSQPPGDGVNHIPTPSSHGGSTVNGTLPGHGGRSPAASTAAAVAAAAAEPSPSPHQHQRQPQSLQPPPQPGLSLPSSPPSPSSSSPRLLPPPHTAQPSSSSSPSQSPPPPLPSPRLAGYLLLSLSQPLAMLPPPLPSRAPQQLHVDALAVAPGWRRRGVGSTLLAAAEQLALRWGGSSLWLHVDSYNGSAVQLYSDRGYGIARILPAAGSSPLKAALAALPAALLARITSGGSSGSSGSAGSGSSRSGSSSMGAHSSFSSMSSMSSISSIDGGDAWLQPQQQGGSTGEQPMQPQQGQLLRRQPRRVQGRQFVMQKRLLRLSVQQQRRQQQQQQTQRQGQQQQDAPGQQRQQQRQQEWEEAQQQCGQQAGAVGEDAARAAAAVPTAQQGAAAPAAAEPPTGPTTALLPLGVPAGMATGGERPPDFDASEGPGGDGIGDAAGTSRQAEGARTGASQAGVYMWPRLQQ